VTVVYTKSIVPGLRVVNLSRDTKLPIAVTFNVARLLLALMVGMCIFAVVSAIFEVTRIGPAAVFSR
jgi:hypothetical protein